ncbi:MAG: hypothetical protein JNK37_19685 [Verrucomicrobiales bacterium]|nr:hypothetical protein [Verrucomicrobiales bacterium]
MPDPKAIIRYLRECYRENGHRGGLWNIHSGSVSLRLFLNGKDFLHSRPEAADSHYIRESTASTLAREAALHRKERELLYGTLFVIGRAEVPGGRSETVCAPLLLYPATLVTTGLAQGAHLHIDPDRGQLNAPVLEAIGGEDFAARLEEAITPALVTEGCVGRLRDAICEALPDRATDEWLGYPELIAGATLRTRMDAHLSDPGGSGYLLLSAACVALVQKSTEMRGVLNELDTMSENDCILSSPVLSLMGEYPRPVALSSIGRIPATLSPAQERVVASARVRPLTVVIGPPGTGKSFTIAALAIEALSRNQSVLIAAKMDHAVDVVTRKIEESIGLVGVVNRGGRSEQLRRLKDFIDELLTGLHTTNAPDSSTLRLAQRDLERLEKGILALAHRIERRISQEIRHSALLADPAPGFLRRWARRRLLRRIQRRQESELWELTDELASLIDRRNQATIGYLRMQRTSRLAGLLRREREMMRDFLRGLRARTGTRQSEFFSKFSLRRLLDALPVWLVTISDIHRILPLELEPFDLAIIDEATQCDIASALPILQRARRAVIVGDPKQLRHLSFLPATRQHSIAERFGLNEADLARWNFRDVSLLDLALGSVTDQDQIAFLNEHFRSRPGIIAFSNREFYADQLHIMTGFRPGDADSAPALRFHHLPQGRREENGTNPAEAEAIINAITAIAAYEAPLPTDLTTSIGVLSPFRDQADCLLELLSKHPDAGNLITRHDLLVGTAHTFQGEERDHMFVSLVVDDHSPSASLRFLQKPDVFNVAITRARLQQDIFQSISPGRLDPRSLLARYLASDPSPTTTAPSRPSDAILAEIADALRKAGATVRAHVSLAGTEVDLVYSIGGRARGVDLITGIGQAASSLTTEQALAFRRAGLAVIPVPVSVWMTAPQRCLDRLLAPPLA